MNQRAAALYSLFVVLVPLPSLYAQTELLRVVAPASATNWGFEVATLGDVDGDGKDDFAVASTSDSSAGSGNASIRVYSGATGAELYIAAVPPPGPFAPLSRGNMLAATGDVDGDGIGDFVHGAPTATVGGIAGGGAFVRSGADGSLIGAVGAARDTRLQLIGWSVSGYGDVDGDQLPEVLIGAPDSVNVGRRVGAVVVYSPARDTIVRTVFATVDGPFGDQLATAGDVDGDGSEDFAVTWSPLGQAARRAMVVSGRTGAPLWELDSTQGIWRLAGLGNYDGDGDADLFLPVFRQTWILDGPTGAQLGVLPAGSGVTRIRPVGDQDGLGRADFVVGDRVETRGSLTVYSGETGNVLLRVVGDATNTSSFGLAVDRIGDLNGDGRQDFLVSDPGARANPKRVVVLSWDGTTRATAVGAEVGEPCGGSSGLTPDHSVSPRPVLGSSIRFGLVNGPRSANAILTLGLPASLDLAPLGAADCVLRVMAPSISLPGVTSSQGAWSVANVQVPTQPSFEGLVLNSQILLLVPTANSLGVITSNGWQLQLGR